MTEISEIAEKIVSGHITLSNFSIMVDGKSFPLIDVSVVKSTAPVKKPTMRGGVYFANMDNYKLTGTVTDFDILPMLSGKMLGPNTDFAEIPITAKTLENENLVLITNLTDMMQNSKKIVLNMVIVRIRVPKGTRGIHTP